MFRQHLIQWSESFGIQIGRVAQPIFAALVALLAAGVLMAIVSGDVEPVSHSTKKARSETATFVAGGLFGIGVFFAIYLQR